MTAVTIVGMGAGALLLITAIFVFISKKEFPAGGVAVTLVALVLIGMSQWSTIKIKGGGIDIDLIRLQLAETAKAVDAVAEQTVNTAAAVEKTRSGLLTLTSQLETQRVLSSASGASLRRSVSAAPRIDTTRLNSARVGLRRVIRP